MPRRKLTEEEKTAREEAKEEKRKLDLLERDLRDLRERYVVPEPTRFYEVGDNVKRGAVTKSIITEVLDDGKIYKLHEWHKETNYGRPFISQRDAYAAWYDLLPYIPEKWEVAPVFKKNEKMHIQYGQRDMYSLIYTFYHAGVDTEVDYQRGNVWKLIDKIELLDSIFNNIDIGKFVFIRRPYGTAGKLYEILDGKQRITALTEFFEGRYRYNGLYYHELNQKDRNHFDHYTISWGEIEERTEEGIPSKYKYEYFLKLNTQGHAVDKEHLDFVRKLYEEAE